MAEQGPTPMLWEWTAQAEAARRLGLPPSEVERLVGAKALERRAFAGQWYVRSATAEEAEPEGDGGCEAPELVPAGPEPPHRQADPWRTLGHRIARIEERLDKTASKLGTADAGSAAEIAAERLRLSAFSERVRAEAAERSLTLAEQDREALAARADAAEEAAQTLRETAARREAQWQERCRGAEERVRAAEARAEAAEARARGAEAKLIEAVALAQRLEALLDEARTGG